MGTDYKYIEYHADSKVARIILDHPEKRNALNDVMLKELTGCIHRVNEEGNLRMLVIRGNGPVFCAGADLQWFRQGDRSPEGDLLREAGLFYDCCTALYRCSIPTVCIVHGAVFGGANGLLAACDMGLACTPTKFSFSEVRLGLVPATIAPFIINKIGGQKARELMLTAKVFDEVEASNCRLVNFFGSDAEVERKTGEIEQLIKQSGPRAVRHTKKLILSIEKMNSIENLREETCRLLARVRKSPEAQEGIRAFLEKRNPSWHIQ